MKNIKKLLLVCFTFVLLLSLVACTAPTETTGTGNGGSNTNPVESLKDFVQGDKVYVKVDEGLGWYADYVDLGDKKEIPLSDFFSQFMSYAQIDITKYDFKVNGVAATAETSIKIGAKITATNKTPQKLELKEGEYTVAFEMYHPGTGREQGMTYAMAGETTLKNFFETNITEGRQSYEDFAKSYDIYVNNQKARSDTKITPDSYIFCYYTADDGQSGNNQQQKLTVKYSYCLFDGKKESTDVVVSGKSITLDEFIKSYTAFGDYAASALRGTWTLNGKYVQSGDTVLTDEADLSYKQHIAADKSVVVLRTVGGAYWSESSITIESKSITLRELFETYIQPGADFATTLERIDWTYNGKAATADTVITDATTLYATQKGIEIPQPDADEVKVGLTVSDMETGIKTGMDIIIPKDGVTLKSLYEDYMGGESQSFENLLGYVEWYVDGKIATADTKITEESVIVAVQVAAMPDQPSEPEMTISYELNIGSIHSSGSVMVRGDSVDLRTLYTKYLMSSSAFDGMTFEETLTRGTWTVNGSEANGDTVIKDGDQVVYEEKQTPPASVSVCIYNGDMWYRTVYVINSDTITLKDLFEKYIQRNEAFEVAGARYAWSYMGTEAFADTVIHRNGVVNATIIGNEPTEPGAGEIKMTVVITTPGGHVQGMGIIVPEGSYTLKDFFDISDLGGDDYGFEDTLEEYVWYVDGKPADANTIVTEKSEIVAEMKEILPPNDSFDVILTVVESNETYTILLTTVEGTSITMRELFDECLAYEGATFEKSLETGKWMVDGKAIDADYVITKDTKLMFVFNTASLDDTITVDFQIITDDDNGQPTTVTESYIVINGITLAEFVDSYDPYIFFEESLRTRTWYVNGRETSDGDLILADGDLVSYTEKDVITIYVTNVNGNTWSEMSYEVIGTRSITLGEFFRDYLSSGGDISSTFADFTWTVGGMTADADTMLYQGSEVVMTAVDGQPTDPDKDEYTYTISFYDAEYGVQYGSTVLSTEKQLTLAALYELYCQSLDPTREPLPFEAYYWYVGEETADADTIVTPDTAVHGQYFGDYNPPSDSFLVSVSITKNNGYTSTVNMIVEGYAQMELHTFYILYLSEVGNYEDYEWTVNGSPADVYTILTEGASITLTEKKSSGEDPNPPVDENIITVYFLAYEGEEESPYQTTRGIKLADFLASYGMSYDELVMYSAIEIHVNGKRAEADTPLNDGDRVSLVAKAQPPVGSMTVHVEIQNFEGVTGPGDIIIDGMTYITLRDFVQKYAQLGDMTFEDTLAYGEWFINGKSAAEDDLIYDGDRVSLVAKAQPPVDSMTVYVVVKNEDGILNETTVPVSGVTTITLREFVETYGGLGDQSFEDTLENIEWLINDKPATGDDWLYDGDTVTLIGGFGEPGPADSMTVYVVTKDGDEILNESTVPVIGVTTITLREFAETYGGIGDMSFEETLAIVEWYINDKAATGDDFIYDQDTVTIVVNRTPSLNSVTVYAVVYQNNEVVSGNYITIDGVTSITLREFAEKHAAIGDMTFDESLAYGQWYINETAATGDDLIYDKDVVIFMVTAEPSVDSMTVYVITQNGDDISDKIPNPIEGISSITLREFVEKYGELGSMSFEDTLEIVDYFINGKAATGDDVLYDQDIVTLVAKSEPKPESITITVVSQYPDGTAQVQSLTLDGMTYITLREFVDKYNMEDYNSSLSTTEWFINDKPATGEDLLYDGDTVTRIVKETVTPEPGEEEITVYYQGPEEMLPVGSDFTVKRDITVAEFFPVVFGAEYTYESVTADYNVYVNGCLADGNTVLNNLDLIALVANTAENSPVIGSITIVLVEEEDGKMETMTIPANSTLWYLLNLVTEGYADDVLKSYEFYGDDQPLKPESLLADGMTVVGKRIGGTTTPDPADGITITMELIINGVSQKADIPVEGMDSITLRDFFEKYVTTGESFDKTLEGYTWTLVDGTPIGGDYILTNGSYVVCATIDNGGGEEEYYMEFLFEDGNSISTHYPAGLTLVEVLERLSKEVGGEFADINSFLSDNALYFNGKLLSASEMLPDEAMIDVWSLQNDGKLITVTTVIDYDGYYSEISFTIPTNSTLLYFANRYNSGNGEGMFKQFNFQRNGESLTADSILSDGDVLHMIPIINIDPPAEGFTVHYQTTISNGMVSMQAYTVTGRSEITLGDFLKEYVGISYYDMDMENGEWMVNNGYATEDTLLYGGESVRFQAYSQPPVVEPNVPYTVSVDVQQGLGLEGTNFQFAVIEPSLTIEDFFNWYLSHSEAFSGVSLDFCEWMIDKNPADRYSTIEGSCTIQLTIHMEIGCAHQWNPDGYCGNCMDPCPETDRHFGDYLGMPCPTCGYSTGGGEMTHTTVTIVRDGMENMITVVTPPAILPTLDEILIQAFNESFDSLYRQYIITYDGMECNDGYVQVIGGRIVLIPRGGDVIDPSVPTVVFKVYIACYYISTMWDENGNEVLDLNNWYYNSKENVFDFYEKITVRNAIEYSSLMLEDSHVIYLNGEQVTDLDQTFISADSYIVIVDARTEYDVTITVQNDVAGTVKTFHYACPVWFEQFRADVFADIDLELYEYVIRFGNEVEESVWYWDESTALPKDATVIIHERTTDVRVEVVDMSGNKNTESFEIIGAIPTAEEFISKYIGGNAADWRVFCYDGGELREIQMNETIPTYYWIIIPKALLKDTITVKYSFTMDPENTYTGTLTLNAPIMLDRIFDQVDNLEFYPGDVWSNYQRYILTVDGERITGDKGAYFTLLWKDVTVEATFAYNIQVQCMNVPSEMLPWLEPIQVSDPNTTVAELFELFGLNPDDFVHSYDLTSPISQYFSLYDYTCYFYLTPKTINFTVTVVDSFGNQNDFVLEGLMAPVTVEMLMQKIGNHLYFEGDFAAYRWTCSNQMGEKFDITDPSYVWLFPENSDYAHYSLYLEAREIYINVEIRDSNGMNVENGSYWQYRIERDLTLSEIAALFGYAPDSIFRFGTSYNENAPADAKMAANETIYIYINQFTLWVDVYGAPEGDMQREFSNLRGGQYTVGDILKMMGYDWSMIEWASLDTPYEGGIEVTADYVIKAGSYLRFYYKEQTEFQVYFYVNENDIMQDYSHMRTEPIALIDLLAEYGYSWDQVSYGYGAKGDITADYVIDGEDKLEVYLVSKDYAEGADGIV